MKKIYTYFIAMISTSLLIYVLVRFFIIDTMLSITPGWHTIIYPPETVAVIITLLFPFFSLLVYALFKLFNKV
jgi:hypothetical protein